MERKVTLEIIFGAALFLIAGACGGYAYGNRNLGVQGELRDTRYRLNHYLLNEAMTQSEMTTLSEFQLTLAQMELYHVRYTICNQENYESIEAEFQKDEQRWEENLKKEQSKPSEFEGGSMASMDHNMRMTAIVENRIKELKQKWVKK